MEKKFPGLDILRFLASFIIIFEHYGFFFQSARHNDLMVFNVNMLPGYSFFAVFYQYGFMAVQVFWALSGFIFFWKYKDVLFRHEMTGGTFFCLRLSRLYPLHLATLIIVGLLQWYYIQTHGEFFSNSNNDFYHFSLGLFMASGWGLAQGPSFNHPAWSISTEILAYIVFFLVARRLRMTLPRVAAGLVVLVLADVAKQWVKHDLANIRSIIECLWYFMIGGGICLLYEKWPVLRWPALCFFPMSLVLLWFDLIGHDRFARLAWTVFAVALLLAFVELGRLFAHLRAARIAGWLGDLTYSSYLLHFLLQIVIVSITDHFGISRAVFLHPLALVAYVALVYALSFLCFSLFERPVQVWLRRLLLNRKPA